MSACDADHRLHWSNKRWWFGQSATRKPNMEYVRAEKLVGLEREGTVWGHFSSLSKQTGSLNLGQGFPNWNPPYFLRQHTLQVIQEDHHQYARAHGNTRLCKELASRYTQCLGRELKWDENVCVTNGSTMGLYCAITALCSPDDEVVLIEPYFGVYRPQAWLSLAKIRYVKMKKRGTEWIFSD